MFRGALAFTSDSELPESSKHRVPGSEKLPLVGSGTWLFQPTHRALLWANSSIAGCSSAAARKSASCSCIPLSAANTKTCVRTSQLRSPSSVSSAETQWMVLRFVSVNRVAMVDAQARS